MQQVRYKITLSVFCLIVCLTTWFTSFAGSEPVYTSVLRGDSIKVGGFITVKDSVFFDPVLKPGILRTNAVNNIVSLRINEYSGLVMPDSFKVNVKVRLIYTSKDNVVDSITEKVMTVDYFKSGKYKSKDIVYLNGAYSLTVKVLEVTASYASLASVLPFLELENKIRLDRDYVMNSVSGEEMNCTDNAIQQINKDISSINEYGELKIYWTPNRVVEQYDVEWTYLDKSAIDNGRYTVSGELNPTLIFRNNATRIRTTADTCMIPLLYDGDGSLFYRVRGVQESPSGEIIATSWSSDFISAGGLGRHDFLGHERKLNWQATTTFAEEAKRKSVVQYFDGSLRNRQTVTRDNTTDTTVVAETLYDKQGRPVIQVLPSPSLSKLIGYTPGFNVLDVNGSAYDKTIYDTLLSSVGNCDAGAPAMANTAGANKYYSPNNTLKDKGFHQFIPNANGYAFSETQYTQDNTGRINKQGGVGQEFQIGSQHETKYYYGNAEQTDIDALFGTEAGDASHYQKNMVRDANGQYSVSYVDMHGRTIATALAGENPTALQRLSSYRDSLQYERLLNPTNNIIQGSAIRSSKAMLVTLAGNHTFTYSLGAESLTLQDCQQRGICYDCLYDLTITVTDDCNNQSFGGEPLVIQKSNFKLFSIDTTCNVAIPLDTSFVRWLEPGTYNITKELAISKEAMQFYRDSIYLLHNTCLTYDSILTNQKAIIRDDISCTVGSPTQYEYQSYRNDMLMDLYPMVGQYGELPVKNEDGTTTYPACYSIFNEVNNSYRRADLQYFDGNGNSAMVANDAGIMVSPQALSPDEFVRNFQPSWATALLVLHPEYQTLIKYESFSASLIWEEDFTKTETYAAAKAKGYLNPTGNTSQAPASAFPNVSADPLFTGLPESNTAKLAIQNGMQEFKDVDGTKLTLWGFATAVGKCPVADTMNRSCAFLWNQNVNVFNESSLCEGERDMAWRVFKTQYLSLKRKWLFEYLESLPGHSIISAPCIGNFVSTDKMLQDADFNPITTDLALAQTKANQLYTDNCEAYATTWWTQLQQPCTYYGVGDSTKIISYLVEVCKQGSDINHPYGSSTTAPNSNYRFKSFEDVIKFYNDSTGRTTNIDCNAYLIKQPLPYAFSAPLVRQDLFTKPDSCACSTISTFSALYQADSTQYGSFSNFMLVQYKTKISQGDLDSLMQLCNGSISCNYISRPISLPTIFQCAGNSTCASCDMVKDVYDRYLVRFPAQIPLKEETDTIQQKINTVFSNFLNNQLGFSYSAVDYLNFIDSCNLSDTSSGHAFSWSNGEAVRLRGLLNDFQYSFKAKADEFVNKGHDNFGNWGVGGYFNDWTFFYANERSERSIIDSGIIHMPFRDSAATYGSINYNCQRNFNVNNEFAFECRVKNPGGTNLSFSVDNGSRDTPIDLVDEDFIASFIPQWSTGYYELRHDRYYDSAFGSPKNFNDWHTVKYVVKPAYFRIYYDGQMIKEVARDSNSFIYQINGFHILGNAGQSLQMDWFKLYMQNDSLIFQEDFNNYPNFARPDPKYLADLNCQDEFNWHYNINTDAENWLTNAQIDSVYLQELGFIPDYCDYKNCSSSFSQTIDLPVDSNYSSFFTMTASTPTLEGGYVAAGQYSNTNLSNSEVNGGTLLVKNDNAGVPVWRKNFSAALGAIRSIIQVKDGGYLSFTVGSADQPSVTKFDHHGNLEWSTPLGTVPLTYPKLVETRTGRYLLLGHVNTTTPSKDLLYVEFRSTGRIAQKFQYTLPKSTHGSIARIGALDAIELKDSVYVVGKLVAYVDTAATVLEDAVAFQLAIGKKDGQVSALQEYHGAGNITEFTSIVPVQNGFKVATRIKNSGLAGNGVGDSTMLGITSLDSLGRVNGRSLVKRQQDLLPQALYLASDYDSSYYSAYLNNSSLFVSRYSNGLSWNTRLDTTSLTPSHTSVFGNTGIMALPGRGVFLENFGYEKPDLYVAQIIGLNGQFACGAGSFVRDSGTYSLVRNSLTVTRTVLTDTAVTQNSYATIGDIELLLTKGCNYNSCAVPHGLVLCGRSEAANEPFAFVDEDGCADSTTIAIVTATELYRIAKDSLLGSFEEEYQQKCLNAASLEQFTISHPVSEYHYTLYYYDLAGNLVKTISPEGVTPNRDSVWLAQVDQKRKNGELQVPAHSLATVYRYNTLNQVVTQQSPDGGFSKFWYDRLGRLSVSQNAKQKLDAKYSFTRYDALGRIIEVGQKPQGTAMTNTISRDLSQLTSWLNLTYTNTNGDRTLAEQVTSTMYDIVDITTTDLPLIIPVNQKSYTLRNRVSYTRTYDYLLALEDNTPRYSLYDFSSTYSYDIHGNVDTLLQQYRTGLMGAHGDNRFKVLAYKYDLISGKVNQVHYQPGQSDQLYHRYAYDAENRLTDVYVTDNKATIKDRDLEEHDAHYEYYKHGPLARTVLGNQQVQGLDYAYTLQGWLKGVNSTGLTTTRDMGNDSKAGDIHPLVARDAFGFNLNYFTGDYLAISGKDVFPGHTGYITPSTEYRALYNGNISSMAVNIGKFNQPQLYNYQYDQLNRLVAMDAYRGYNTSGNSWSTISVVNDYKERIKYDGNGNILGYLRNGTTADNGQLTMDSLSYKYFNNSDGTYRNNRLRLVRDSVATGNYSVDIDDQLPRVTNAADSNYVYDAIGNLVQDKSENITDIQWNVYGKIQKITKTAVNTGDVSAISYWYDAAGNRVGKKLETLNRKPQYSWYTRDASGNVMGVYQYEGNTLTDDTLRLREHHLYGSSRIGVWNRWINMDVPVSTGTTINLLGKSYDGTFERGNKFFELSNHLGNVLATVSDKKFGHNGGSGIVDYYDADVLTASDYYPFGMLMPGRQFGQGENFRGVLVNGTTTVNGYTIPIDLSITGRVSGEAAEYVASNSVEFGGEFESIVSDEFTASIADASYAGTGNQVSGGGAYGTAGRYRYGFNGKENDNEVKGVGNQQDYGMRIYDPRLGKFLSIDPATKNFPNLTPYQFASNTPIQAIDLDGLEAFMPLLGMQEVMVDVGAGAGRVSTFAGRASTVSSGGGASSMSVSSSGALSSSGASGASTAALTKPWVSWNLGPISAPFQPKLTDESPNQTSSSESISTPEAPPTANPHGENTPPSKKENEKERGDILVYRSGGNTDLTFTPRPGKDDGTGPRSGLSANLNPLEATRGKGGKVQILSVNTLESMGLIVTITPDGHAGIRPRTQEELKQWAATRPKLERGEDVTHLNTHLVKVARIGELKVSTPKTP